MSYLLDTNVNSELRKAERANANADHLAVALGRNGRSSRAGDVIVQRGTEHAWVNRSDEPAQIGFVMLGALDHSAQTG